MRAHPEAERFAVWSKDKGAGRAEGGTEYVWWQRGQALLGLRDVGHQSAWIIGAVCPARDSGVALVMTRLDTAAMNCSWLNSAKPSHPGAHGIVPMDKAGWNTISS